MRMEEIVKRYNYKVIDVPKTLGSWIIEERIRQLAKEGYRYAGVIPSLERCMIVMEKEVENDTE